jgi:hypothetical protein
MSSERLYATSSVDGTHLGLRRAGGARCADDAVPLASDEVREIVNLRGQVGRRRSPPRLGFSREDEGAAMNPSRTDDDCSLSSIASVM